MSLQIKKATRSAKKIRLALTGPSGSGKTMSSLMLASGMCPNGRILVIDTEDGSSNLYADHSQLKGIDFDVLELTAPYTVTKLLAALKLGEDEKYDVIIADSISHFWAGEGGLLDKKQSLDSRGGNSFANWSQITKEQELLKNKIQHSKTHLIVTMRSKQEYVLETNEKGKQAPKKVGLAPIQRDGMEYEFTTVFDIGMDHQYMVSKDRTGLFEGEITRISRETGEKLRQWLSGAKDEPEAIVDDILVQDTLASKEAPKSNPVAKNDNSTDDEIEALQRTIRLQCNKLGWGRDKLEEVTEFVVGKIPLTQLNAIQLTQVSDALKDYSPDPLPNEL